MALVVLGGGASADSDDGDGDDDDDDGNGADWYGENDKAENRGGSCSDMDGKCANNETRNRRSKRPPQCGGSVHVWHLESAAVIDRYFGERAQIFLRHLGVGADDRSNESASSSAVAGAAAASSNAALTWDAEFNAQVRAIVRKAFCFHKTAMLRFALSGAPDFL